MYIVKSSGYYTSSFGEQFEIYTATADDKVGALLEKVLKIWESNRNFEFDLCDGDGYERNCSFDIIDYALTVEKVNVSAEVEEILRRYITDDVGGATGQVVQAIVDEFPNEFTAEEIETAQSMDSCY